MKNSITLFCLILLFAYINGNESVDLNSGTEQVLTCPGSSFLDKNSNSCVQCHEECNECYGSTEFDCKTCRHFRLYEEGQKCVRGCPAEYIEISNDQAESYCSRAQPEPGLVGPGSIALPTAAICILLVILGIVLTKVMPSLTQGPNRIVIRVKQLFNRNSISHEPLFDVEVNVDEKL